MKNKISKELKAWVRAVHGRRSALALHCGISRGTVDSWLHERCGIATRHHSKILELTGVSSICNCNYSVSVTGNKPVTNQQLTVL